MYRDEMLAKLAQLLSGYGDSTWSRLSTRAKRTYSRAAFTVLINWQDIYTLLNQLPDHDPLKPQPQVKPSSS